MTEKVRAMIVEDNPVNLKLASDLLEIEGFEVLRCTSAEDAAKVLKQDKPQFILMDVGLPGIDGLEFTRILKSDEHTRDIKIIAFTAFAMKGDEDKALEAGCDGYITKPIDTRLFKHQILNFLDK